jgi:integrase/recombinase XerD
MNEAFRCSRRCAWALVVHSVDNCSIVRVRGDSHDRLMMLDELERRNYSQNTQRLYLYAVAEFARHFRCSPDQLGLDHILKPNSVCVHVEALRFLFVHVLKRRWTVSDIPYPKRSQALPLVLSHHEVARLINAAANPVHRVVLMTLYATGCGALKSRGSKSRISTPSGWRSIFGKDRDVMLSPKLLEALRQYWRGLKVKPTVWLFPGGREHTNIEHPINDSCLAGLRPGRSPRRY